MPIAHDTDLALARRIAAGDEDAASELFQRLAGEMYGYARRMLVDAGIAEDVLQEAMLAVLRSAERYDGRVALRAWAFGILRNKIVDAHRRAGRRITVSSDDPEAASFHASGRWKDLGFQPWSEDREMLNVVRGCMEQLPTNQYEALVLRALEGMSGVEAAEVLGVSEANLRQILHRARAAVRRCADAKTGSAA
jgi:RNA polymerase sigma-70 factor (ECF subfamily)